MSDPAASRGTVAPPPLPAEVGIVAALPMEVGTFLGRLRNPRTYRSERLRVREGELGGKVVALVTGGMGRRSAERAARHLLAGHRPQWVISAGFAGALDPELERGDALLLSEIADLDRGRWQVDLGLHAAPAAPGRRLLSGRLVTVDQVVRTAAEKAALRARSEAAVVDMETAAVAAVCAAQSVRFVGLRVVSDDARHDLPPEILTIMGPTGSYRIGAACGAIVRRPGSLKELWRLRGQAQEAAQRLAEVLTWLIGNLH